MAEAAVYLKPKFAEAVDSGYNKVVIDIHPPEITAHGGNQAALSGDADLP